MAVVEAAPRRQEEVYAAKRVYLGWAYRPAEPTGRSSRAEGAGKPHRQGRTCLPIERQNAPPALARRPVGSSGDRCLRSRRRSRRRPPQGGGESRTPRASGTPSERHRRRLGGSQTPRRRRTAREVGSTRGRTAGEAKRASSNSSR